MSGSTSAKKVCLKPCRTSFCDPISKSTNSSVDQSRHTVMMAKVTPSRDVEAFAEKPDRNRRNGQQPYKYSYISEKTRKVGL